MIEYRQTFSSDSIARLFPNPELYGEEAPGTVWFVLTPDFAGGDPNNNLVGVDVRIEHP